MYSITLKQSQDESFKIESLLVTVRKVTPDSLFADVNLVELSRLSPRVANAKTFKFRNLSKDGVTTNKDWPWFDPGKRMVGLGRYSFDDIADIRRKEFSSWRTALVSVAIMGTCYLFAPVMVDALGGSQGI